MNLVIAVVAVVAVTLLYTLFIRPADIPPPDPVSPTQHLDERKAAIYENLRDLQFEYRVGKLSDSDYQRTKLILQKELATVLAAIEQIVPSKSAVSAAQKTPVSKAATAPGSSQTQTSAGPASGHDPAQASGSVCPHCGARFPNAMKFCGECGKAMS